MGPIIDVVFGKWRDQADGDLACWSTLARFYDAGDVAPRPARRHQCLTLEWLSAEEVDSAIAELKAEIDAYTQNKRTSAG